MSLLMELTLLYSTSTTVYLKDQCWDPILPRDAMCKRGLCCRPVSFYLSVPLSVCHFHVLYPHDGR